MDSGILTTRPVIIGVNLIAFALLVWVIASSTLKVLTYHSKNNAVVDTGNNANINQPKAPPVQMNQVIAAHLFGRPEQKKEPVQKVAPKTRLNLALTGVIASNDPKYARAIIASGSKPAKSYGVGDMLGKSNVKLHSIEADKVLLERNGKLESLAMVRNQLRGADNATVTNTAAKKASSPAAEPEIEDDTPEQDDENLPAGLQNLNKQLQRLNNNMQTG